MKLNSSPGKGTHFLTGVVHIAWQENGYLIARIIKPHHERKPLQWMHLMAIRSQKETVYIRPKPAFLSKNWLYIYYYMRPKLDKNSNFGQE